MVLFKRKPVQWLSKPQIKDEDTEIWAIPETSEFFLDYEAYLHRMDFLKLKRFMCEITGHSGLTFFEAQRSETLGSQEVDSSFPEALREPVLRRVQFSTVSRIDHLVDQVFDGFKQDFYPGESVSVVLDDNTRINGVVLEKANLAELRNSDGSIERKAFSRYFVRLKTKRSEKRAEEALVDDDHITRDRKAFTKQMLRSFLKNNVTREAWNGAPWLVKQKIAEEFKIGTTIPLHLQYENRAAMRKVNAAAARAGDQNGMYQFWATRGLPELKPATKGQKSKMSPQELANVEQEQYQEYQRALQGHPIFVLPKPDPYAPQQYPYPPPNGFSYPHPVAIAPPPPPPIKYPIEDLEVDPRGDVPKRPALKFMSPSQAEDSESDVLIGEGSVGDFLETWNTLNVYCQAFVLDSFTFDDFVEAMQLSSTEFECELFDEIHCAVLKQLVKGENDQNGSIQISLPDLPSDEDDEDDSEEESDEASSPTPEPEPVKRTTRSSANKAELERAVRSRSTTADIRTHRAADMFDDYGWIERLRKRDFREGGWQLIMVGLLHQLAGRPRLEADCEKILTHLAPLDADATQETAYLQYSVMDVNMRLKALQIICMLTLETKAVKIFLEESAAQMTELRKTKIEHQRTRKDLIAELKIMHEERRRLQPEPEKSVSPVPETASEPADVEMEDAPSSMDTEDEGPQSSRSLRRGTDRAAERKRKREEEEERKVKAAEAKQANKAKGSKEYQRILKKIDSTKTQISAEEAEIATLEDDLREADCPRTRVLGKDRFWNRYYWFERNAMPHAGLPDASTADAGYANGRIWVQGPDDLERRGFLDLPVAEEALFRARFGITPAERKERDEGATSLPSARSWGFYDDPTDVDALINYLDPRGARDLKLRKELNNQRDIIVRSMEARLAYLAAGKVRDQDDADDQPPSQILPPPSTRTSKRTKTGPSSSGVRRGTAAVVVYSCSRWRNDMARRELGHRHLDPPIVRSKSGRAVRAARGTAVGSKAGVGQGGGDEDVGQGMRTRNQGERKGGGRGGRSGR